MEIRPTQGSLFTEHFSDILLIYSVWPELGQARQVGAAHAPITRRDFVEASVAVQQRNGALPAAENAPHAGR